MSKGVNIGFAAVAAAGVVVAELVPLPFQTFRVGSIKPSGWFSDEMHAQAQGLSGHLDLFYAPVRDSPWFDVTKPMNLSKDPLVEDPVYWLNGVVSLGAAIDDNELQRRVNSHVEYVMAHQGDDGWLGPLNDPNDWWSRYPFILSLTQYAELIPEARSRVGHVMLKFFMLMRKKCAVKSGNFEWDWAGARAHDLILAVHWYQDHYNVTAQHTKMLQQLNACLHSKGFDWTKWYTSDFPNAPIPPLNVSKHVDIRGHMVNNVQAVKYGVVWGRETGQEKDVGLSFKALRKLLAYHGQAMGAVSGDEYLAGRSPSRGIETCGIVELMFSLEQMLLGTDNDDPRHHYASELLEIIGFNGLFGANSGDWWLHPYLQFANTYQGVWDEEHHVWANDGPDAAAWGLDPNWPCCTANLHQGLPKWLQHAFLLGNSSGNSSNMVDLYSNQFIPSTVKFGNSTVSLDTDYPASLQPKLVYTIEGNRTSNFTLFIRHPRWAGIEDALNISVDGVAKNPQAQEKLYHKVIVSPTVKSIEVSWEQKVVVRKSSGNGFSAYYGNLLLSAYLGEHETVQRTYAFGARDVSLTSMLPWNLAIDFSTLSDNVSI